MGVSMKHIVYKYDNDLKADEMDFDAHGSLAFTKGDILSRHGTSWKIESVEQELSTYKIMRIPTYWVYLSRVVVN
jgi:hypothetical protein